MASFDGSNHEIATVYIYIVNVGSWQVISMLFPCIYVSLINKHPVMTGSGHTKLYIDYLRSNYATTLLQSSFHSNMLMIQLPCFTGLWCK